MRFNQGDHFDVLHFDIITAHMFNNEDFYDGRTLHIEGLKIKENTIHNFLCKAFPLLSRSIRNGLLMTLIGSC